MDLKATQQFNVSVEGRDSKGNVAPFENPKFTVSPPTLGTFEVNGDDEAAGVFKASGPAGSGQLAFQADGIVGEGELIVTATLAINVLPGTAVTAVVNAGEVTEQES